MTNLSQETEAFARRLAATQGLTVDEAIRLALEEKARAAGIGIAVGQRRPRDQSREAVTARHARTNRFVAELAAMPVLDSRSPRDIMDDLNAS